MESESRNWSESSNGSESSNRSESNKLDELRVLELVNIPKDLGHCGRLFNISCQYGQVHRITTKDDKSCFIELEEKKDADVALRCLQGLSIFGGVLEISITSPRAVRSHGGKTLSMVEFDHIGGSRRSMIHETCPSKVDSCSFFLFR